jgi:DNA polymerase I-like protein with 3'-5' exonuclease and polymerase domains
LKIILENKMTISPGFSSIIKAESQQEWESALQEIEKIGICGLKLLTTGQDPLSHEIRFLILTLPNNTVYIADCHGLGKNILSDLAGLLENGRIKKVLYDGKSDLAFIRAAENRMLNACNLFDLMLASQICWSGYYYLTPSNSPKNPWKKRIPDHGLAALAERHLGIILNLNGEKSGLDEDWTAANLSPHLIECAAKESAILLPIHDILAELLAKNGLQKIADLEFRAICSLAEMEISGIYLDCDQAKRIVEDKENELCNLVWTMQDEARKKGFVTVSHDGKRLCYYLNPDRQEDVKAFLRSRGCGVTSTKAEVLRGLAAAGCAFAEAVLRYRHVSHHLAFLNNWLEHVHAKDGRIHPQYFQIPSSTGRISSRKPNAQQIPRKGDDATAIRRLFLPAAGKKFVKADFSAIELRIMAFLSGDRAMQEAFRDGIDLHRLTASKTCGATLEEVTDSQRQAAKIMNFLLIYGGSAKTLQWKVLSDYGRFMSLDEAEEAKARFFQTYEGVRVWQERQLQEMSYTVPHYFHNCIQGYFFLPLTCTATALGRRRIWPRFGTGIKATKFQMYNTPCQGTGADLIKLVMCEVYDKISSEEARIIGSIHDEILLEVPEERAEEYAQMLKEIMERIGSELLHPVPVKTEVKILSSLGE